MTPSPDTFPDLTEAGEHALPASFFGLEGFDVHVLVGEGDARLLTEDERRRAETFRSEKRRREFVRGRALVRKAAALVMDLTPHTVALATAPGGGFLPIDGKRHLTLTHTGDLAAVAFSHQPVGLDAERIQPVSPELAERMLAPGESPPDVSDALLHVWTAKEAVLKATGQGLRGGLRRFSLDWHASADNVLLARTRLDEASFRVAVRCYCNTIWAVALLETGADTDRSELTI